MSQMVLPVLTVAYSCLQIPVALATAQPERRVKPAIDRLNLANYFDAVVTAEDNGSPEVSMLFCQAWPVVQLSAGSA
jgi:phosphoglycolate phosphatase-like HAD superfamily hydrolase